MKRAPSHPGRLLKRELTVRKLSADKLSLDIGALSGRVTDIVNGRRPSEFVVARSLRNAKSGVSVRL